MGGAANTGGTEQSGGTATAGGIEQSGGEANAGAAPTLDLPPGCHARTPSETSDLCSLGVDCDGSAALRTYCHKLESGQWECQCANQEGAYRLQKVAGLRACALAAALCSDPHPQLGAETCEPTTDDSTPDSCSLDLTCSAPVKLDATVDAEASRVRFGSGRCGRMRPDEGFGCDCGLGAKTWSYRLVAESGQLACRPLVDFCMKEEAPVYSGAEVCTSRGAGVDGTSCFGGAECGPQQALTEKVSLAKLASRSTGCGPSPQVGSDCYCGDMSSVFEFHVSTSATAGSCDAAISNCNPGAVIKSVSTPRCTNPTPDDMGDWCQTSTTCLQDVTLDNRGVTARGYMDVLCRRDGAGLPWRCACASGPKVAQLQLGAAGARGPQACSQATTACLQKPGLFIGPYQDPRQGPPEPVP